MHYKNRYEIVPSQIQGTSFSRSLAKEDDVLWEDNEDGNWKMVNTSGTTVASGALAVSADKKTMSFDVQDNETSALTGKHTLYAYVTKTDDATFNELIAIYEITSYIAEV